MSNWTVWVGGGENNEYLLTREQADYLAGYWIGQGYDEVTIERIA
jgi:hypothetical protein